MTVGVDPPNEPGVSVKPEGRDDAESIVALAAVSVDTSWKAPVDPLLDGLVKPVTLKEMVDPALTCKRGIVGAGGGGGRVGGVRARRQPVRPYCLVLGEMGAAECMGYQVLVAYVALTCDPPYRDILRSVALLP